MDDGTLVNDGSGWLVDERGRAIKNKDGKQIGADGLESGLLNILFGGTSGKGYNEFSVMEKVISFSILEDSGIGKSYPNGKYGMSNAQWDKNDSRALNMDYVMEYAGKTVATQVFTQYYDSTVDSIIAGSNGVHLGVNVNTVPIVAQDRFNNLYQTKALFYESAGSFVDDSLGYYVTGEFMDEYTIPSTGYRCYASYNYKHFGEDFARGKNTEGDPIFSGLSGRVKYIDRNHKNNGTNVTIEYGYGFENNFISTGLYGNYYHMVAESNKHIAVGDLVEANLQIGNVGNTGNSSGAHLHYDMFTVDRGYKSDSSLKIMLGYEYNNSVNSLQSRDNYYDLGYESKRTVYKPSLYYEHTLGYRMKREGE